jgi:hypothetical protein
MNFWFLVYIFAISTGIIGGTYAVYQSNRPITSFIYFGGVLAAAIIFGLRWFRTDGSLNEQTITEWPPVINVCPDFLSLSKIDGKVVCIDTIGVAPRGGLQKNTGDAKGDMTFFDLQTSMSDKEARRKKLCEQCQKMTLTWEGVYDGTQCVGGTPPYPPSA